MRTEANDQLLYSEANLSQEEVADLSPRAYDAIVADLKRVTARQVAEGKLAAPGTPCHHCGKPIRGDAVSFHGENQPPQHYHEHHAQHHKHHKTTAIFSNRSIFHNRWRGE
jgi:hypothetical protein